MKLNRSLQLSILEELRKVYPSSLPPQTLSCYSDNSTFHGNIIYLLEHNLVEGEKYYPREKAHPTPVLNNVKITADGLDFLEDDGGLSTILNKVTIKIDREDLNKIIATKLKNIDEIPQGEKSKILNMLKNLPADGIQIVYKKLLHLALDNPKAVIDLFHKLLEQYS